MGHPGQLTDAAREFLTERHLATLTTVRADGSPHVVPVGFSWDGRTARVITSGGSAKARHAARGGPAAVCQVDGARWLTLVGPVVVRTDPAAVAEAVGQYAARYRQPRTNPARVVLEILVEQVLGSRGLLEVPTG